MSQKTPLQHDDLSGITENNHHNKTDYLRMTTREPSKNRK